MTKEQNSLTEDKSEVDLSDFRFQNFGYVKGQIVSVSPSETINGKYIYMVRPALNGTYKKPIRVVTSVPLKVGRNYHFKGYLDTAILNRRLIPFLSAIRIKKTSQNKLNIISHGSVKERLKESAFFALQDVKVKSVTKIGDNSLYIVLSKKIEIGHRYNYLKLNCISLKATHALASLTEGDTISNIVLAMHINDEQGVHHFNEKSLRIVEYNVSEDKLTKLLTHINKRF